MRYPLVLFAASLSALAAFAGPSAAQPYRAREGVQSGQVRSLDEILNGIRRQRPGSLADVQGPNPSAAGGSRYRLKWVTPDGRVLWLDTDARTGRVLGVEGDDRPSAGLPQRGFAGVPPPGAGPPPGYGRPPNYGRFPPGYGPPQNYPPPPGYGPSQNYPVPPQGLPPGYGAPPRPVPQPQAVPSGPPGPYGPRGFEFRSGPPGLARIPPGRARGYGRER